MTSSREVKALVFDVFGTVVDWRGSVVAEGEALGREKGLQVDWVGLAEEWRREGYSGAIARINRGEDSWVTTEVLHRRKLDELLPKYGATGLTEQEIDHFTRVWHRLEPWPDSVPGLTRLKTKFIISTLSNGSFALLTNMAKRGGLPWDCIISAELFEKYKPNPETYQGAARLLGLDPDEVMLVAAHANDLRAAQAAGLHAAYVMRPKEWGREAEFRPEADPSFDVVVSSFLELADRLGA
jgi:2-haloacid dehalogenase